MGYAVRMPKMGMTMEEGTVIEWHVDVDGTVEADAPLVDVESEKSVNEVTAREGGTLLERFADAGDTVAPGDPIGYVGDADAEVPDDVREEVGGTAEEKEETAATDAPTAAAGTTADGPVSVRELSADVSPRARAYAGDAGVDPADLDAISGSGPGGAVIERDVIEAVEAGDAADGSAQEGPAIREVRELTGLRRSVADRMTTSAREAPQVTLNRRVDVGATLATIDRLAADRGVEVSITDFLLAAVARAAEEHPALNARFVDGEHRIASDVNVSVAVDVEGGLVTPVVERVGELTVEGIGRERAALTEAVQAGTHDAADLQGGTFTVTNLGMFGVDSFDPLLNPPQVAILGVGRLHTDDDGAELPLSLTFDHRVADGADAARFLAAVADALTRPLELIGGGSEGADTGPTAADESPPAPPEGTVTARSAEGLSATVRAREFEWRADEPEERGGTDSAATPVEQFLGSLSSCLALTTRLMADRRDVAIETITVEVTAEPSVHDIDALDVQVEATADEDPADVERVVTVAERACPVNGIVSEDVDRSIGVTVSRPS
ncbi:2-oxo acid dehydrogenase subunit E2 [Haloplanus halophilus]|uniref:2-oxo acid dehydrogenase subunit E2 n=1 Tax=Haloplanus halophilus TaxID=2949993 RepID=UPI0020424808|nr:2-oxo acid dehydrogenase subunit E2 [Haloplanus sp. GDY1]